MVTVHHVWHKMGHTVVFRGAFIFEGNTEKNSLLFSFWPALLWIFGTDPNSFSVHKA